MSKVKIWRSILLISIFLLVSLWIITSIPSLKALSETPPVQWQQFLNGSRGYSVLQTKDGGYAVTGINGSTSLLIKTDSSGNLLWAKAYKIGEKDTNLPFIVQTKDGGYALGGTWENRYALIKADSEGNTQWIKTYEYNAPYNSLRSFIQTADEGYAIVGTFSPPQDPIAHTVGQIWFVKADALGNMQWNKTIEGPTGTFANSILQTIDEGYVLFGTSWSSDVLPSAFKIIKTDADGNEQWNKTYGGTGKFYTAESDSGIITKDGGYLLAGVSVEKNNEWLAWLVKTDSQGNMIWNQNYGEIGSWALFVIQTQEGGYAFAGLSNGKDGWVVKTDAYGALEWNQTFPGVSFAGSSIEDFGKCITQTSDGEFVLVGTKNDKIWLAKMIGQAPSSNWLPAETIATIVVAVLAISSFTIIVRKRRSKKTST